MSGQGSALDALYKPFTLKNVHLNNRIAMAPMTRSFSPGQVPGKDVASYYARRALGGVGLIITEGTTLADDASTSDPKVPKIDGDLPVAGWTEVVKAVHAVGGKIFPQIWHVGAIRRPEKSGFPDIPSKSPSGLFKPGKRQGDPMSDADIAQTIEHYVRAAQNAQKAGFDGIEIHGAHGYLIDQFFWEGTNERNDRYGGTLTARTRFACEVVSAIRAAVGEDYPIILRFSQWKQQDYTAKLAQTPKELEEFLAPMSDAGVDCFHCSTRRYWEPEFDGSDLNLAGWAKKLTGKPTITVGSIGLDTDFIATYGEKPGSAPQDIRNLVERLERDEFDLAAVGRALIANPDWPIMVREGRYATLTSFERDMLFSLA